MGPGEMIIIISVLFFLTVFTLVHVPSDRRIIRAIIFLFFAIEIIVFIVSIATIVREPETTVSKTETYKDFRIVAFPGGAASNENSSYITSSDDTYRYYYETTDGIVQGKIPADKAVIDFTDGEPLLRIITQTITTDTEWQGPFYSTKTETKIIYKFLIPKTNSNPI